MKKPNFLSLFRRLGVGLVMVALAQGIARRAQGEPDSPAAGGAAHDATSDANARASAEKAVRQAAAALTKEYEAHEKDATVPQRDKSNYFVQNPSPGITVDAIMDVLTQSDDAPASESCYIKWQLLSGLPAKADGALAPRIGDLYANAPGPAPNPSLTSADKSQLNAQMSRMTADEAEMVNTAWTKHLSDWSAANAPIISYSEALFGMLPEGLGATTLGFQDTYQRRAAAGVACDDFANQVISQARDWAVGAQPPDLLAAAGQCARWSKVYGATFPPSVYTGVKWDAQRHQLSWQSSPIHCLSKSALDTFGKFLRDQANTPGGGIQIKPGS